MTKANSVARQPSSYLLPRLHRLAERQDENFLTECLAYVLEAFLEVEPELAECLLAHLRGTLKLPALRVESGLIHVHTQFSTAFGIVDLVLKSDVAVVFIEVKVDSGFEETQLERYSSALKERTETQKALGTLTRNQQNADSPANFSIRWYEIGNIVRKMNPATEIGRFIRNEFLNLLQHRGLVVERISWELINGVKSFASLVNMLDHALRDVGLETRPTSGAMEGGYFGYFFYKNRTKFFTGVYYTDPGRIYINSEDSIPERHDVVLGEMLRKDRWLYRIDLESEEAYFFSRSLQSQLDYIVERMTEAVNYADTLTAE